MIPAPKADDRIQELSTRTRQNIMRIGEIAIISPAYKTKLQFIQAVCDEIVFQTEKLIFGRLQINNQLVLHLYGLDHRDSENNPSWDLVSRKLLGYIMLFDWDNPHALDSMKDSVDSFLTRYQIPILIASNTDSMSGIPAALMNVDINISKDADFTFCDIRKPQSVRNVLVMLVDAVLDRLS